MKYEEDDSPPPYILYGEDAERFREAIENPIPASKEELKQVEDSYKLFRKMGAYTVEDLKCCGNCKNFEYFISENMFHHKCKDRSTRSSYGCCDEWLFDANLEEDRG